MMQKTQATKLTQIKREWLLVDAKDFVLGRLASKVVELLTGKNKIYYSPNLDCGDYVIIVNAKDLKVSGDKENYKIYYRYTGYPGGLREKTFKELKEEKPQEIIKKAVWGMLPKGKLGKQIIKKLFIYENASNPHEAQKPRKVEI